MAWYTHRLCWGFRSFRDQLGVRAGTVLVQCSTSLLNVRLQLLGLALPVQTRTIDGI
jgi:hypothetical protein